MDKTKEECITLIENYYCQRLTELVDLKMYDEAHAIFEEFSLGDDESYQWFFIKILSIPSAEPKIPHPTKGLFVNLSKP